jgi:hypothetical protein
MLVEFPSITAATYGGAAKVVSDFQSIVATTVGLAGPAWVSATALNSTPVVLNVTVWFPANFTRLSSAFDGLNILDYYVFLVIQLPALAFPGAGYRLWDPTAARVSMLTNNTPGVQ